MTKEDKQLLLKDLCARIPYRTFVCLNPGAYNKPETCILIGIDDEQVYLNVDSDPFRIDHIKPYLRPISSMTEEELYIIESNLAQLKDGNWLYECVDEITTLLNSRHLDFRGLIPMGLALEAPSNMYKTK